MLSRNPGCALRGCRAPCVPHHPLERRAVRGAGNEGPRSDDAGVAAHDLREAGEPEPGVQAGGPGVRSATITAPPAAPARIPAPASIPASARVPAPPEGPTML